MLYDKIFDIITFFFQDCFFLVRGNHEAEEVNRVYGFENEVKCVSSLEFEIYKENN